MLVKEVMNKKVVTANPEMNVRDIARIMVDNKIGSVVIETNGRPTGIVTKTDILRTIATDGMIDLDEYAVSNIMTRYMISIDPDAKIDKAIKVMQEHHVKKLVVLEHGWLAGIITTNDIAVLHPKIIENIGKLLSKSFEELE